MKNMQRVLILLFGIFTIPSIFVAQTASEKVDTIEISKLARQAAENYMKNLEVSEIFARNPEIYTVLRAISDMDLSTPGLSDDLDDVILTLDEMIVQINSKVGVVPDSLIQLKLQFVEKKEKLIEYINNNSRH
jgi:hypothetical protein